MESPARKPDLVADAHEGLAQAEAPRRCEQESPAMRDTRCAEETRIGVLHWVPPLTDTAQAPDPDPAYFKSSAVQ